jgi:O-methyltransferase
MQKVKVIVFGASAGASLVKEKIEKEGLAYEIIAYADNNKDLQGTALFDKPVIDPKIISSFDYDQIIISTQKYTFIKSIIKQLSLDHKIQMEKINTKFVFSYVTWEARIIALENVSKIIFDNKIGGEVAELGVFQGDFAQHINKLFPDKKLYLFDTFEGFPTIDVKKDMEMGNLENIMTERYNFSITSENLVLDRMIYPKNCIVKKGYFPETTDEVEEKYAFVSLDADLYQPMFEGLKYFYPRLEKGGYIFLHDFYHSDFPGVKKAVVEYNEIEEIKYVPLGDGISVAIVK